MVATVQPDPYRFLMRRIGYSVGLENTLERLQDLAEVYAEQGDVTRAAWDMLKRDRWGLGRKAKEKEWGEDHIGDVFHSLGIMSSSRNSIHILPTLDELGLIYKIDRENFKKASSYIFAKQVLLSDGDIFLNCVAAESDKTKIKRLLKNLVEDKRMAVKGAIKNPDLRERLHHIISIETQKKNQGSAGNVRNLSSIRSEPLVDRTTPLRASAEQKAPEISGDYMKKVPPKRRLWADSLGLYCNNDGSLTSDGKRFLNSLKDFGFCTSSGSYSVWPLKHELAQMGIKAEELGAPSFNMWEFLWNVWVALSGEKNSRQPSSRTDVEMFNFVEAIFSAYRELNMRRTILRKEIPVQIIYGVHLAVSYAREELPMLIGPWIDKKGIPDKLILRQSRNFEAALSLRASANKVGI